VSIRLKIILVVLPVLVATLVLSSLASSFSARNGITRVAVQLLAFKAGELRNYMQGQWNLLAANQLSSQTEYREAAQRASASYARSLATTSTERILATNAEGGLAMDTGGFELSPSDRDNLLQLAGVGREGWVELTLGKRPRVGYAFAFRPFGWYCLVTQERAAFYRAVTEITWRNLYILAAACALSVALLLLFSGYLTRPLTRMAESMRRIIDQRDLSERVAVEYGDEIGGLAHTFNVTIGELEKAYNQVKQHAFRAVLHQNRERDIRRAFQRYVPAGVIDTILQNLKNPEAMLVPDSLVVAVLFADIRGFTAIAESMRDADELISNLNRFFTVMVDIIDAHGGIVDKYIGDCIMAFFGAPQEHGDEALKAVLSALEMLEAAELFNREQVERGKPEFHIGIGVTYGNGKVGNVGSDKKMNYTVMGDMVNLASRLEGLTKIYAQELIFSESVHVMVHGAIPCRRLDKVEVLGMSQGETIFTARQRLEAQERTGWNYHHAGLRLYSRREFRKAAEHFRQVQKHLPGDMPSAMLFDRCRAYLRHPPPASWTGSYRLKTK
jgi:adenylate cyclase